MAKELPKTISDYSDANPLIPAVQMVRFQDGRNTGLEEAAALVEAREHSACHSKTELAAMIRGLLFTNDR